MTKAAKTRVKPKSVSPSTGKAEEEQLRRVWETPRGWRYWTSVNNTQVGLWYGGTAFAFMLFAGVLALIMRALGKTVNVSAAPLAHA